MTFNRLPNELKTITSIYSKKKETSEMGKRKHPEIKTT